MKVLHFVLSSSLGGMQTLCREYAKYTNHDTFIFYGFGNGPIIEETKKYCKNVYGGNYTKMSFFKMTRDLKRILKQCEIQKIVLHDSSPIAIEAILLANTTKIPIYFYAHSVSDNALLKNRKFMHLICVYQFKRLIKRADKIICISEAVKDSYKKYNIQDKSVVIYNGTDVKYFNTLAKDKAYGSTLKLIYIGRLTSIKGVDILLKALSMLSDCHIVLNVVGDGPEKNTLCELSKHLGLTNVSFFGEKREIYEYLSDSDVFVHPALYPEGFGLTLIEAMSAGLPCVAFNVGAIQEVLGNTGRIINNLSIEGLAKELQYVYSIFLNDKYEFEKWRKESVNRSSIFSIERMSGSLDDVLSQ